LLVVGFSSNLQLPSEKVFNFFTFPTNNKINLINLFYQKG